MRLLLAFTVLLPLQDDDSLDALVDKLGSSSFEEQGSAASALERLGEKALPALEKALKRENGQIREWAAKIRRRILDAEGAEVRRVIARLGSKDFAEQGKAAEELRKMGERAIPWLEEARRSDNEDIRAWARKLLAELRPKGGEPGGSEQIRGRFASRFGDRDKLASGGGGDRATQGAVLAALSWLARHQEDDGSWSASRYAARCGKCGERAAAAEGHDAGVTGLALLAFLGAGHTHLSQAELADPEDPKRVFKAGDVVRNAQRWLVSQQDREGCLADRNTGKYMYDHAIAAQALAEAYGMTEAPQLRGPTQKAVDFLVAAQNPGKGWRYSRACGDNDTSVTGWGAMALKAAELSGLAFPRTAYDGVRAWLDEVTEENYYRVGYTHKGTGKVFVPGLNENFSHHETLTAIGVVARLFMDRNKSDSRLGGSLMLSKDLPTWKGNDIDFYYWYWGSLALFQYDGPSGPLWKSWNERLKEALVKNQSAAAGCRHGSWEAVDRWFGEGGRVYGTALNALTLEVYYRYPVEAAKKK